MEDGIEFGRKQRTSVKRTDYEALMVFEYRIEFYLVVFAKTKVIGNLDFQIQIFGSPVTYSKIIENVLKIQYHPKFLHFRLNRYMVRLKEFLKMRGNDIEIMEVLPDKVQILAEPVESE